MEPLLPTQERDEEDFGGEHDEEYVLPHIRGSRDRQDQYLKADFEASSAISCFGVPLPQVLQNGLRHAFSWLQGPERPQSQHIKPIWHLSVPVTLQKKLQHRSAITVTAIFAVWSIIFFVVIWERSLLPKLPGYGQPRLVRCMQQAWSINDDCGLDGIDCRPFANETYAFQCPQACATQQVWNPHTVGDQELVYQELVVGGNPAQNARFVYRADSSICQAAVHAGVIDNNSGGPVVLSLLGESSNFWAIKRNGINSVGFDASFPKSFTFNTPSNARRAPVDLRWFMLAFSVFATVLISLCTSSAAEFFASTFTILFMHVIFVSDKPNTPTFAGLLSISAERLLPASLAAYVIYIFCVRPQLFNLDSLLDKTILWLGAAWFGALENYTLDHIPIRRLTPADLRAQPGAVIWLAVIVVLIVCIAIGQIHYLRREGRLIRYLKIYAALVGGVLCFATIPGVRLRIHHYILALLLLPGTAIQTRPSLVYQGLLVGLFVNGAARWGFASILQTDSALRDMDGRYDSSLPNVTAAMSPNISSLEFNWAQPPEPFDGVSVLVNDVERYRWYNDFTSGQNYTWSETRSRSSRTYFRFAYMGDGHTFDYTRAAIWELDGSWNSSLWKMPN